MCVFAQQIENLHTIISTPSAVESTSLVLAYGLDIFYVRCTPSKEFDMLAADFNYSLLILIISGLMVATFVAKQTVAQMVLRKAWK